MIAMLGPMPTNLAAAWTRSRRYIDRDGRLFNSRIKRDATEENGAGALNPPLEQFIEQLRAKCSALEGHHMDDATAAAIFSVLCQALPYHPLKRPSAAETPPSSAICDAGLRDTDRQESRAARMRAFIH